MTTFQKKDPIPILEDLCVRFICKNLQAVTYLDNESSEGRLLWKSASPNIHINCRPAQKILIQLCKRGVLDDGRMNLFSAESVDLISPVIKEASITPSALRVLKEFHLINLSAMNLPNLDLNSIVGCLGEWTVKNLSTLNITGTSILCEKNLPILVPLARFKNLQVLNVSRTEFTTQCLQIVVDDLPNLHHINISRTHVTDIHPLLGMSDRLTGLIMHRMELEKTEDIEKVLNTIVKLNQLRILDVSDKPRNINVPFRELFRLCSGGALPHLTHVDLSGNQFGMRLEDVRLLLENHPKLVYAGFASWLYNSENELEGIYRLSLRFPKIIVLGDRGEQLLLNTLTRNKDRAVYLQNALHNIFEATSNREPLKAEVLQAVLRVMRLHLRRMEMILAGTAVIYNLTKGEQSKHLPLELLNRAVRMTLTAMEKFPNNKQLQKNCFLTLCSDHVLYRAKFSSIQCCELVFQNLLIYDDVHMKRMGVAIISIVAAEIPTSSLSDLAKDRKRLRLLLTYVAEKCLLPSDIIDMGLNPPEFLLQLRFQSSEAPAFDTILRFTLSALWNLTDECPEACIAFVEEGGLRLYMKVLKRFADQEEEAKNHVYTKCLGLMSNVAEVEQARSLLLIDGLMDFFFKMQQHANIQISYFAAGIIAHLSCITDEEWMAALHTGKENYIRLLGQSICRWHPPPSEMVAYRSFEPFEQLVLHPLSRLEVHLWAVWAIHHIITRKEARYVPALLDCNRLLAFMRYVVTVDETVLCTNSFQHQTTDPDYPERELLVGLPVDADNLHVPLSLAAAGDTYNNNQSDEGSYLDYPTSYLGTQSHRQSQLFTNWPSPSIGSFKLLESTTEGISAFVGPDSAQLECARLMRRLVSEILEVVDRTIELTIRSTSPPSQ